ncbi:MAG: beta-lactamase family protein [Flavobacteriales bacterium]|nr:beta-lactamase family protein [Flavobacteriales bacterium]
MACSQDASVKAELRLPETKQEVVVQVGRRAARAYFDSLHNEGRFNGVVLLSSHDTVSRFAIGKARLRGTDTLRLDDVFQLASLSKPITALGILRLVEQGKLALDAPVRDYLFDFPDEDITVRSLLDHTSGMGNYIYVTDSLWNNPDSFMSNDDVYDIIRCEQVPKYHPPHQRFDYCNTNYALLPVLIERVSGLTFQAFMEREIFLPLQMDSTHYLNPWLRPSDQYRVLGHYPNGDPKRPFYLDAVIGDKSLYSSVGDLFKLYKGLRKAQLWSAALLQEAMRPSTRSGNGQFYGLGWRIRPMESDTLIFHNGWWRGFRSYFWMSGSDDKVAIVLTNSIRGGYLRQDEIWPLF